MTLLNQVWQWFASCVGQFLVSFSSHWYLSIFLYLVVLSIVIDILVSVRGTK